MIFFLRPRNVAHNSNPRSVQFQPVFLAIFFYQLILVITFYENLSHTDRKSLPIYLRQIPASYLVPNISPL